MKARLIAKICRAIKKVDCSFFFGGGGGDCEKREYLILIQLIYPQATTL